MSFTNTVQKYSPLVLRLGMSAVFLYFGISQLRNPQSFVGWLPPEVSLIPISPVTFVILNGVFETIFATLLAIGLFSRVSALLLGLHLLGITYTIGYTEVGVRDFGLAIASLACAMSGPGPWAIDSSQDLDTAGESNDKNKEQRN
ncbi:MAG TPA: DoxX family protein [Acidobacteriota bacterium]|nr:DoxX family protein [Acidobacteriota bacterium]